MDPLTAAGLLTTGISALTHRRKKGPNRNAILARYRAERPTGYVTPEDLAMSERARTRLAAASQALATRRRAENARQVTARGLAGPAAAALEQQATAVEAGGAEEAARTSADLLYRAYGSNLGYERQKSDTAFGAEVGLASQEAAQNAAQESEFWNSVLGVIPGLAAGLSPNPATAAGAAPPAAPRVSTQTPQTYRTAPVTPAQRRVRGPAPAVYR